MRPSLTEAFESRHPVPDDGLSSEQENERFLELEDQIAQGEFKPVFKSVGKLFWSELYPRLPERLKEDAGQLWVDFQSPILDAIHARVYDQILAERKEEGKNRA